MLRSVLAATVLAVFVGACSSTAPSPATPTSTASPQAPAASASIQPPASVQPPASASAPASVAPSGSAVDLKGLLPAKVGNVGLTAVQFSGPELNGSGAVNAQLQGVLSALGRNVNDMTMAIASDPLGTSDLNVTALTVRDTPVATFLTGYVPLLERNYGPGAVTQATRNGRQVYVAQPPGKVPPQVLVPSGNVLFVVVGSDASLVDQAIAELP
jgi:hypothetical protein